MSKRYTTVIDFLVLMVFIPDLPRIIYLKKNCVQWDSWYRDILILQNVRQNENRLLIKQRVNIKNIKSEHSARWEKTT